ncbi:hypothetical protein OKW21_003367 [Catalinimonas alkaloidigena]|uniref:DUF4242 domain-containing protein n=1 Tax=Catalinimonas alkaloidigena TaxID=1075417 RepID=UPI0024061534|nr:DUF4242 domain-containing protein [Catalinimonas alkaloidigena]MDF9798104.1 hypothetical protein [Catalinimonas alkaloidigena]
MRTLQTLTIILSFFLSTAAFAQQQEKQETSKSTTMKTYLIERDIPGAGSLSQADLQGASQKSCEVLNKMETGIEWINSYVLEDKFYCVYKAQNEDLIKEHAEKGGFPCTNIMEIKANIDPSTAVAKTN